MHETRVSLGRMAGELGPQHLRVLLDMTSIREAVLEELEEWEKRLLENNLHSGAIEMIAWQDIKYIDLSAVRSGGFRNFMEAIGETDIPVRYIKPFRGGNDSTLAELSRGLRSKTKRGTIIQVAKWVDLRPFMELDERFNLELGRRQEHSEKRMPLVVNLEDVDLKVAEAAELLLAFPEADRFFLSCFATKSELCKVLMDFSILTTILEAKTGQEMRELEGPTLSHLSGLLLSLGMLFPNQEVDDMLYTYTANLGVINVPTYRPRVVQIYQSKDDDAGMREIVQDAAKELAILCPAMKTFYSFSTSAGEMSLDMAWCWKEAMAADALKGCQALKFEHFTNLVVEAEVQTMSEGMAKDAEKRKERWLQFPVRNLKAHWGAAKGLSQEVTCTAIMEALDYFASDSDAPITGVVTHGMFFELAEIADLAAKASALRVVALGNVCSSRQLDQFLQESSTVTDIAEFLFATPNVILSDVAVNELESIKPGVLASISDVNGSEAATGKANQWHEMRRCAPFKKVLPQRKDSIDLDDPAVLRVHQNLGAALGAMMPGNKTLLHLAAEAGALKCVEVLCNPPKADKAVSENLPLRNLLYVEVTTLKNSVTKELLWGSAKGGAADLFAMVLTHLEKVATGSDERCVRLRESTLTVECMSRVLLLALTYGSFPVASEILKHKFWDPPPRHRKKVSMRERTKRGINVSRDVADLEMRTVLQVIITGKVWYDIAGLKIEREQRADEESFLKIDDEAAQFVLDLLKPEDSKTTFAHTLTEQDIQLLLNYTPSGKKERPTRLAAQRIMPKMCGALLRCGAEYLKELIEEDLKTSDDNRYERASNAVIAIVTAAGVVEQVKAMEKDHHMALLNVALKRGLLQAQEMMLEVFKGCPRETLEDVGTQVEMVLKAIFTKEEALKELQSGSRIALCRSFAKICETRVQQNTEKLISNIQDLARQEDDKKEGGQYYNYAAGVWGAGGYGAGQGWTAAGVGMAGARREEGGAGVGHHADFRLHAIPVGRGGDAEALKTQGDAKVTKVGRGTAVLTSRGMDGFQGSMEDESYVNIGAGVSVLMDLPEVKDQAEWTLTSDIMISKDSWAAAFEGLTTPTFDPQSPNLAFAHDRRIAFLKLGRSYEHGITRQNADSLDEVYLVPLRFGEGADFSTGLTVGTGLACKVRTEQDDSTDPLSLLELIDSPTATIQPDTWHRINVTCDTGSQRLCNYIDGTCVQRVQKKKRVGIDQEKHGRLDTSSTVIAVKRPAGEGGHRLRGVGNAAAGAAA